MSRQKDVHTEHCCIVHGCKYDDRCCTVTHRKLKQSYPCEDCQSDKADMLWDAAWKLVHLLDKLGIKSAAEGTEFDTELIRNMSLRGPYEYEKEYTKTKQRS